MAAALSEAMNKCIEQCVDVMCSWLRKEYQNAVTSFLATRNLKEGGSVMNAQF